MKDRLLGTELCRIRFRTVLGVSNQARNDGLQLLKKSLRGQGFSHARFGGPGEKTPLAAAQACDLRVQPRRFAL